MRKEPGWYTDPYFRNHERYWDGRWTDQIRRIEAAPPKASAGADPSSLGEVATGPPTAKMGRVAPSTESPTAATQVVHDDDTLVVPPVGPVHDIFSDPPSAPVDPTLVMPAVSADDVDRRASGPAGRDSADAETILRPPSETGAEAAPEEGAAGGRRAGSRRLAYVGAVLVLGIVVIVTVVVVTSGGGKGHGAHNGTASTDSVPTVGAGNPAAQKTLASAAAGSLGQKTAAMSISVTLLGAGQSPPQQAVSAGGAFYLSSGLGTITLTLPGQSASLTQHVIFDGPTTYWSLVSSPVPGKTWVVASTDNLPSANGPSVAYIELIALLGNPGLLVKQLTLSGVSATRIGTATVNGEPVTRYAVTISSNRATFSSGYGANAGEEVDVGGNKVVNQVVLMKKASVNGQVYEERIVVAFSRYGLPFFVGPPPTSEVVPVAQYNAAL